MKREYEFKLPVGKKVKNTNVRIEDGKVVLEYELENKFEPKDGDFCISDTGLIFIYKESWGGIAQSYVGTDSSGKIFFNGSYRISKNGRSATLKEKVSFLEQLKMIHNMRWNCNKKCLEDIFIPKFGDIVKCFFENVSRLQRNYMICIYPNKIQNANNDFFDIANINLGGRLSFSCASWDLVKIVPASELEKQELFDKLTKAGKYWNFETKTLEDIRLQPKDGDFIKYECCGREGIFIYKDGIYNDFCGCYCGISSEEKMGLNGKIILSEKDCHESKCYCRYATDSEKRFFLDRLEKECHKKWNAEKKCLEDIRWKPQQHEIYYYIDSNGTVDFTNFSNSCIADRIRVEIGNCFRTEEAAQPYAEKFKELFKNSKAE